GALCGGQVEFVQTHRVSEPARLCRPDSLRSQLVCFRARSRGTLAFRAGLARRLPAGEYCLVFHFCDAVCNDLPHLITSCCNSELFVSSRSADHMRFLTTRAPTVPSHEEA